MTNFLNRTVFIELTKKQSIIQEHVDSLH